MRKSKNFLRNESVVAGITDFCIKTYTHVQPLIWILCVCVCGSKFKLFNGLSLSNDELQTHFTHAQQVTSHLSGFFYDVFMPSVLCYFLALSYSCVYVQGRFYYDSLGRLNWVLSETLHFRFTLELCMQICKIRAICLCTRCVSKKYKNRLCVWYGRV